MTFLPIVQRELRVAARRKSTWRVRAWTAALAMFAALWFLVPVGLGAGPRHIGGPLFGVLVFYASVLCLLAGVFLTADCLSEEKREGTLGLLFLTDLRGHDVVLGKFCAVALNAMYGLWAVLPILGIPVLLGGVTGGEFWRTALALMNALFVSLAAGLCASAASRDAGRSMSATFAMLVGLAVVLPLAEEVRAGLGVSPGTAWLAQLSPAVPILLADDADYRVSPSEYWMSLATAHVTGWACLFAAGRILKRSWRQERPFGAARKPLSWLMPFRRRRTGARRGPAGETNPAVWLAQRYVRGWGMNWTLVALAAVGVSGVQLFAPGGEGVFMAIVLSYPLMFLMKAVVAMDACRFFTEARRSGAIELLLASPLTSAEIRTGLWTALERTFLAPMLAFMLVQIIAPVITSVLVHDSALPLDAEPGAVLVGIFSLVSLAVDFYAAGWLGMWLSLTMKKPQYAAGLTMLYVLVLPACAPCVPNFLINIFTLSWAQRRMDRDIRDVIRRQYEPPAPRLERASPRLPPPVIAARPGNAP